MIDIQKLLKGKHVTVEFDSTPKEWDGYRICHSCLFRHSCCRHCPPVDDCCKHWKLGKCYTCKHVDDSDDNWFKRGCEAECMSGCEKYRRDWKRTFEYFKRIHKNETKQHLEE